MSKFFLRIVTPESDFFSGEVEYLSVDTPSGREGFMRGALKKVAVLSEGIIEIVDGDERKKFACGNGIICVESDGITLVASHCGDPVKAGRPKDKASGYAKAKLVSSISKIKEKNAYND